MTVSSSTCSPTSTSTGWKRPPSCARYTSVRLPVRISASAGTTSASRCGPRSVTCALRPAFRRCAGLGNSMRTRSVRVSRLASCSTAATRPLTTTPGNARKRASTAWPGWIGAARASGKAASSHTVARPLMRASVMPGVTVMPARTTSSVMTPPLGAVMVCKGTGWPVASTRSTSAMGMPSSSRRCRAARASAASPTAFTARYSCCAPNHSGVSTSASGAPAAITSPGARA